MLNAYNLLRWAFILAPVYQNWYSILKERQSDMLRTFDDVFFFFSFLDEPKTCISSRWSVLAQIPFFDAVAFPLYSWTRVSALWLCAAVDLQNCEWHLFLSGLKIYRVEVSLIEEKKRKYEDLRNMMKCACCSERACFPEIYEHRNILKTSRPWVLTLKPHQWILSGQFAKFREERKSLLEFWRCWTNENVDGETDGRTYGHPKV